MDVEYETRLVSGEKLLFRPIRHEDRGRLLHEFEELSMQSRSFRFFGPKKGLSDKELDYFVDVDNHDHVAWVALLLDVEGEPAIGVGRWVRLDEEPRSAEAALTVVDVYQHKGVGGTLLWLLAKAAMERGVEQFVAWVMRENQPMIDLLHAVGAVPAAVEHGVLRYVVPLKTAMENAKPILILESHPEDGPR